jgi:hypothetical protein
MAAAQSAGRHECREERGERREQRAERREERGIEMVTPVDGKQRAISTYDAAADFYDHPVNTF